MKSNLSFDFENDSLDMETDTRSSKHLLDESFRHSYHPELSFNRGCLCFESIGRFRCFQGVQVLEAVNTLKDAIRRSTMSWTSHEFEREENKISIFEELKGATESNDLAKIEGILKSGIPVSSSSLDSQILRCIDGKHCKWIQVSHGEKILVQIKAEGLQIDNCGPMSSNPDNFVVMLTEKSGFPTISLALLPENVPYLLHALERMFKQNSVTT
mmetsp:Transcript_97/g.102  ORF Transcript_97/g.102 Transcript_97/m.102 type:complete len:214 (+) Transcript_97:188-829(+)